MSVTEAASKKRNILVLDYGLGNLGSLINALSYLGYGVLTINSPIRHYAEYDAFVLPGVGAFPAGMHGLRETGLDRFILKLVEHGTPGVGICLGMQLMAEWGIEGGSRVDGLGLFAGGVLPLSNSDASVPHIGWSATRPVQVNDQWQQNLQGDFYFVHSFVLQADNGSDIAATFQHGSSSCVAAVHKPCLLGLQFHPEKSQQAGLQLLDSFLARTHT